jgi:ABC-2 type transport system permease protein
MKPIKLIATILLRIVLISVALVLFFSMMAGMYYKSSPRHIKTGIVDEDHSPLSRSLIHNIRASEYFEVTSRPVDYLNLQKQINEGSVDVGVVIPHDAYRDVLNHRNVRILAVLNGTANPIVPKMSLMMLNKIVMTLNNQLAMKVRVEDLGGIPNMRHAKKPLLMVSERVFFAPAFSMESSMLPAFMGLAMQIVSMLIVLFALMANLNMMKSKVSYLTQARQLPLKALIPPFIISWIIVSTAISIAFFTTMYLFHVPFTQHMMWEVVAIISIFVMAMESISYFLALNIRNGALLAGLITLIVMPAFMYSGYLIPQEQMAHIPNMIGSWFPLRYYLNALYPVFNHHQSLHFVQPLLNTLWLYIGGFLSLSALSIAIGQFERHHRRKKAIKVSNELKIEEEQA